MNLLQSSVPNNCDMDIHHRATSSVDINAQNYPERGRTVLIIQHVYNHGSGLQKWRKEIFIKATFRNDGKAAVLLKMRLKRTSYCKQLPHLVLTKRHFFWGGVFWRGEMLHGDSATGKYIQHFQKARKLKSWKLSMRKWSHVTDQATIRPAK